LGKFDVTNNNATRMRSNRNAMLMSM